MSAILRWENPEQRVKQAAAQQARWENPEERKKASAGQLRRYSSAEERLKQSNMMKEVWKRKKQKEISKEGN